MAGKALRVGIMGPGGIVTRVMKDFARAKGVELTAIASTSLERAQAAARRYGARLAFGSYEELAACEDVDLVYVATRHPGHRAAAMTAMRHGKHVLCEKPMGMNTAQVEEMIACAKAQHVFLMEAMWSRFFPAMARLRALLAEGALGEIRHMSANFSFFAPYDPASRLYDLSSGGGALLDVGVYTIAAALMVLGNEPESVTGVCEKSREGADTQESVTLRYASGAQAQLFSGILAESDHRMVISGSEGRVEMADFWHPTLFSLIRPSGECVQYRYPAEDEGYHHEFTHAAQCIRQGLTESPIMPLGDTLAVSRVMEALLKSLGVKYPL